MGDQSNKQIERVKKVVKKAIITALKPIIITKIITPITIILFFEKIFINSFFINLLNYITPCFL